MDVQQWVQPACGHVIERRVATLVRRLPGLRLAVPAEELSFAGEQEIYTIHELPVTL